MATKPCIQCGTECDILAVQLGDIFTLTYLRVFGFLSVLDNLCVLREQQKQIRSSGKQIISSRYKKNSLKLRKT